MDISPMLRQFWEQDYFDYENEQPLSHDEDLWIRLTKYANLNPDKIFAMVDSDDTSIDREALNVMARYWGKNMWRGGAGEAGEPIRGDQLSAHYVRSLAETISGERAEYVGPIYHLEDGGEDGLFDMSMLVQSGKESDIEF